MFHSTVNSPYSVEDTVNKLSEAFQDKQFGVLWDFDAKAKLDEKEVGLDNKFRILEVCNPKIAKQVLTETMIAGYFLPCKVVVYEEDAQTKIGMPRPTVLMEHVDNEKVQKVAQDVENTMEAAMNEAVK
ncbi:DUF302 domain-containing protein [Alkalicoccus halolimnae]|uniref:DUF302 domain-containing protein n=1 Tax=Alkalicoccus halolimnae TaxID=1667239 RepID=A0A5C7F3B4_9BACI|nr:DUF302 domain-containing protein [Alkalicoccus halolimnae]TXF82515.1 DUF302 domain-containing protein [Alkalicoccus halolimnae]